MFNHAIPIMPTADDTAWYLELDGISFTCPVLPMPRRASGPLPDRVDPARDLDVLARDLGPWLKSDSWDRATDLAGMVVSTLATTLTAAGLRLADEIREQFCPDRFREVVPAAYFRAMDFGIRAVAAHAILSRFQACLERVQRNRGPGICSRIENAFPPADLLAAMVSAHSAGLPAGAGTAPSGNPAAAGPIGSFD